MLRLNWTKGNVVVDSDAEVIDTKEDGTDEVRTLLKLRPLC